MLLPDVNVLIYAHREDGHPEHSRFASWLSALATGPEPFALSVLAMVGLVRIVDEPTDLQAPFDARRSGGFRGGAGAATHGAPGRARPAALGARHRSVPGGGGHRQARGGRAARGGGDRARMHAGDHRRRLRALSAAPLAPSPRARLNSPGAGALARRAPTPGPATAASSGTACAAPP